MLRNLLPFQRQRSMPYQVPSSEVSGKSLRVDIDINLDNGAKVKKNFK